MDPKYFTPNNLSFQFGIYRSAPNLDTQQLCAQQLATHWSGKVGRLAFWARYASPHPHPPPRPHLSLHQIWATKCPWGDFFSKSARPSWFYLRTYPIPDANSHKNMKFAKFLMHFKELSRFPRGSMTPPIPPTASTVRIPSPWYLAPSLNNALHGPCIDSWMGLFLILAFSLVIRMFWMLCFTNVNVFWCQCCWCIK